MTTHVWKYNFFNLTAPLEWETFPFLVSNKIEQGFASGKVNFSIWSCGVEHKVNLKKQIMYNVMTKEEYNIKRVDIYDYESESTSE